MSSVVEKFMNTMGITYDIELDRGGISRGERFICYKVVASYKGKKEYEEYHCYNVRRGSVHYDEGNQVIGPSQGIFAYLGMDSDVRKFFETKTRQLAKNFFDNL